MSVRSPYRILLADDNPGVRKTLALVLKSAGYDVAVAEHGVNAIFLLQRLLPHVVIYELDLPQVPGYDFLAMVRLRLPQVGVIAMSSSGIPENTAPDEVFSDAMYLKGQAGPEILLRMITDLIQSSEARFMEHRKAGFRAFAANQRVRRLGA